MDRSKRGEVGASLTPAPAPRRDLPSPVRPPAARPGRKAGADAEERQDQDRCREHDGDVDRGGHLQRPGERLACPVEQQGTQRFAQTLGRGHGATERGAGGLRRFGRNSGRDAPGEEPSVDRGADAAEDGDAQGPAELRARLRDPGRRPRPLGRRHAEDDVVRQRECRSEAQRVDHGTDDQGGRSRRTADLGEDPETDGGHGQAAGHEWPGAQPTRDHRGQRRSDDEGDGERHRPQAGLERPHSEHELKVLGHEEEGPERHEGGEHVRREGGAESRRLEEPQVDQGVFEGGLPPHEDDAQDEAGHEAERRAPREAILRHLLQPVDRREHGGQRQESAHEVDPARSGIPELGQENGPKCQEQDHHGHAHQEHRPPPEVLEQDAAERRADRRPRRVAGDPHPDRDRALVGVVEHVADQGESGRCQRGPGDPEHRARRDEELGAGREGGEHRGDAERARADQEQPAATDPVAQRAHRDQAARDQEPVDVDDPQQLRARGLEVRGERRHGEIQDREVHRVEQAGQGDHAQPDPFATPGPLGSGGGEGRAPAHGRHTSSAVTVRAEEVLR